MIPGVTGVESGVARKPRASGDDPFREAMEKGEIT